MTVAIPVLKPVSQIELAPGSSIAIPNVSWAEYEAILQEIGEHRSARVAYFQETIDITVSLAEYERSKDLISDLVKILLKASRRRYEPFGSTTFKRTGLAGVEPDACFYIQNYQQIIGRRRLQPGDPPPDLAIETDVTSKTTIDAYAAIAVPEVWIYDSGQLKIYLLEAGQYIESDTSPTFPDIDILHIVPHTVERSWQVGSYQALEEFEATIS